MADFQKDDVRYLPFDIGVFAKSLQHKSFVTFHFSLIGYQPGTKVILFAGYCYKKLFEQGLCKDKR